MPATFHGKRLLVIPGGLWQVPIVEMAQAQGLYVICADGTPDPPCKSRANEFHQVRLQDIDALEALAREKKIDAVITDQTDFTVPIVAQLTHRLGLRGLPPEVAERATNKARMRDAVSGSGVHQPGYRLCHTLSDIQQAVLELGLPLFYKPVDAQSSRGVGILRTEDSHELQKALDHAVTESLTGGCLVEQMLIGTECTVEGFVIDGVPTTLAMSDKKHYEDLPGVARTLTYPPGLTAPTLQKLAAANEEVVRALGIPFGITHAEFIVDAQGTPWLVEIAARGGGSRITSHIVPAVCGFHPIQALLESLLGEQPLLRRDQLQTNAAELRFLRLPPGRVVRFNNLEQLRQRTGVLELQMNFAEGTIVPSVKDDRSRHGFVVTSAKTRDEAVRIAENIERDLDVVVAP